MFKCYSSETNHRDNLHNVVPNNKLQYIYIKNKFNPILKYQHDLTSKLSRERVEWPFTRTYSN